MEGKKIFRSTEDSIIAGVCGGVAEYFQIDSSLVRIIFVLLAFGGGSGVLIYIIMWLIIPIKGEKMKEVKTEIKKEIEIVKKKRINILGVVLVLLGLITLWNQIFPQIINWNMVWPIILVLVGILIIFRD